MNRQQHIDLAIEVTEHQHKIEDTLEDVLSMGRSAEKDVLKVVLPILADQSKLISQLVALTAPPLVEFPEVPNNG